MSDMFNDSGMEITPVWYNE